MYEFHQSLSMQVVIRSNNSTELDFFLYKRLVKRNKPKFAKKSIRKYIFVAKNGTRQN